MIEHFLELYDDNDEIDDELYDWIWFSLNNHRRIQIIELCDNYCMEPENHAILAAVSIENQVWYDK